ncbi:MAG: hypothetical protein ACTS3F_09045 [Phycisphaerales bacterium]
MRGSVLGIGTGVALGVVVGACGIGGVGTRAALAQRLDLTPQGAPELADGGVLGRIVGELSDEAEEFGVSLAALPGDASECERAAMRARVALTEWLAQEIGGDAVLAALVLSGALDAFDASCRELVRECDGEGAVGSAVHERVWALSSVRCLCDEACRPMMPSSALDDRAGDPLIRALGDGVCGVIGVDAAGGAQGAGSVDSSALRSAWVARGLGTEPLDAWERLIAEVMGAPSRTPASLEWASAGFGAINAIGARVLARDGRDAGASGEAVRALIESFVDGDGDGGAVADPLFLAMDRAIMVERALVAIDALSEPVVTARGWMGGERDAIAAARRSLEDGWVAGRVPGDMSRIVRALERLAAARARVDLEGRGEGMGTGLSAGERVLAREYRDALGALLERLPEIVGGGASLARPEFVSLLSRHDTAAARFANVVAIPSWLNELRVLQTSPQSDSALLGAVSRVLSTWQRESGAMDEAVVMRAHEGLAAYRAARDASARVPSEGLAALARLVGDAGLARADWSAAWLEQRRQALAAIAGTGMGGSDLALARQIGARLEVFGGLARAAESERAELIRPLLIAWRESVVLGLESLRADSFGRSLEPMRSLGRCAEAVGALEALVQRDAAGAAALATMLGVEPGPVRTDGLVALRDAGRAWRMRGAVRRSGGEAVVWVGELDHAIRSGADADAIVRIRDHVERMIEDWESALERGG